MSFLGEIRRRKVFQVAAVYAVVAWLIIQIVDVISEPLSLPVWFATVTIVSLGLGFPIALILSWAFDVTPSGIRSASDVAASSKPQQPAGQQFTYITQALVVIAVGFLVVDQYLLDQPVSTTEPANSSTQLHRYTINLGLTEPQAGAGNYLSAQVGLSRDGRTLAYVTRQDARTQIYLRALNQLEAAPLSGSAEFAPFFAPDGETLFFADTQSLKKIDIRGGPAQTLAVIDNLNGGTWGDDGLVVVCATSSISFALFEILANGGEANALPISESAPDFLCHPSSLPGGNDLLVSAIDDLGSTESEPVVAILSRDTGELRTLVQGGFSPRFVASTGHIVFARAGSLWAVPFDPTERIVTGSAVPVVEGVQTNSNFGGVAYSISETGTLVYVRGDELVAQTERALVWVNREGTEERAVSDERQFLHARISPVDQRVALVVEEDGDRDVWIYDLERGSSTPLTYDPADDETPLWTPDGQQIVFSSTRDGGGIFSKAADGSGPVTRLTTGSYRQYPEAFSPDGKTLIFREEFRASDLHLLSMEDYSTQELLATEIDEDYSAISPDGRWLAYEEDQEVVVRPFPEIEGGRWQVSRGGGNEPLWHPNGRELIYRQDDGGPVMAVTILEANPDAPRFSVGPPQLLFEAPSLDSEPTYSLSKDGERFLIVKSAQYSALQSQDTELVVVVNWFEELRQLARQSE